MPSNQGGLVDNNIIIIFNKIYHLRPTQNIFGCRLGCYCLFCVSFGVFCLFV